VLEWCSDVIRTGWMVLEWCSDVVRTGWMVLECRVVYRYSAVMAHRADCDNGASRLRLCLVVAPRGPEGTVWWYGGTQ
jgi:hypothetical protein